MAKKNKRAVRGLQSVSSQELHLEMRRRLRGLTQLQRRYERAAAKAAGLARQIQALGGSVNGSLRVGARSRPKNEMSLIEALERVLAGKELGIPQIIDAVQKLGYQSHAASFRSVVSLGLAKHPKIKRVRRGVYTVK